MKADSTSMTSTLLPETETPPSAPPLQSALLSSLMNAQTGGGLDLQQLLAAQAAGGQSGGLDLTSLLAAQGAENGGGGGDERLNVALQWLQQQRAAATQSPPVEETPGAAELELQRIEELRQRREQVAAQRAEARQLKAVMDSMYTELETLRTRNDTLANALGACYLCFGDDPTCPECKGQGVPGSLRPEAATYRQYVAPAVNRVRATYTRPPGGTSPQTRKEYLPGTQAVQDEDQPVSTR